MQSTENTNTGPKRAPQVLISTGVIDTEIETSDVTSLLRQHRVTMTSDRQGKSVLARQTGAFTTVHDGVAVREEFGFRGHVIYVMTARERITDTVNGWENFGGLFSDPVS